MGCIYLYEVGILICQICGVNTSQLKFQLVSNLYVSGLHICMKWGHSPARVVGGTPPF
jgi:hypothetical protein